MTPATTATDTTAPPPRAVLSRAAPIRVMSVAPTLTTAPAETRRGSSAPSWAALRVTSCMVR